MGSIIIKVKTLISDVSEVISSCRTHTYAMGNTVSQCLNGEKKDDLWIIGDFK